MKILHLHTKINLACGISKTIFLIVNNLNGDFEHKVFSLGGDAVPKFKNAGISICSSKCEKRGAIQTIRILNELINIVKEQKIDIIHSHHRYFDLIAFIITKFAPVKTITSVQSKVYGRKIFSYKADYLVACSNSIKDHLINYFRINSDRITVIHNFIDPTDAVIKTEKSVLRRELGLVDQSIIIGFIGRFSLSEKGVDVLLQSFKKLSFDNNQIRLLLIGDGKDIKFINDFIVTHNLKALVLPSQENIFDFYNILDIVVMPSRVEPFGIVAVEAGMMKKSLVATDVDGLREIVDDGVNGSLFLYENVESLTETLKVLINDSLMRIKFGNELYKKVINNFSSEIKIPLYEQTYQQLMLGKR